MGNIDKNEDMSLMIKLTPTEIKNILRDFAFRWANAQSNETKYTIRELCDIYYKITFDLLEQTDPDRFIHIKLI